MHIGQVTPYQFYLGDPLGITDQAFVLSDNLRILRRQHHTTNSHCLDTFDATLQLSNQLLLRFQNTLTLFQKNHPVSVSQKCPSKWNFISQLTDGPIKHALANCSPIRAFLPGNKSKLIIEQFALLDDDDKTHVRCTLYHMTIDDKELIFGLTHPMRGYDSSHEVLIKLLADKGAIELDSYADIYRHDGFDGPIYKAKPSISIDKDEQIVETTLHLVNSSLDIARQNEDGIRADYDTEFLHDYRVNLRKIRSVLSLFKGVFSPPENEALKQAFSDIMKQTNRLRDLDVYLLDKDDLFSLLPKRMHKGLHQMFDAFAIDRKRQLQQVSKMLNSKNYQKDIQQLKDKFSCSDNIQLGPKAETPSLLFATKLIWKRYSKVCQIARQIDENTPDEEVHQLRIQCKKLRYLMEFFAALFPEKMLKGLIKSLKRLQDNLGRFNDFSVQQDSLQEFLTSYSRKHRNKNLIAMAESIGALIILLQQKQQQERGLVMESFAKFDNQETRDRFSEIFHHGTNQ